jgi:hypothetical protein
MKLNRQSIDHGSDTLSQGNDKIFHKLRHLPRMWTVFLLFFVVGASMSSTSTLAQGAFEGNQPTAKAQGDKVVRKQTARRKAHAPNTPQGEGAIITAKRIKLKPGYKFIRIDNNTVEVAGKNERGPKTYKCACDAGNAAHVVASGSGKRTYGGGGDAEGGCVLTYGHKSNWAMCSPQGCNNCKFKQIK